MCPSELPVIVTPWVSAAQQAGATIRYVEIHPDDCTLDLDDLRSKLTSRTRLVAVGCASNAVGTVNPVEQITAWAHEVGALVYLDAVHLAPHRLIDVSAWDCDFLVCSAYKFFGPHVGILWGQRALLEELPVEKLRPAPNRIPERWMTGTQNHECLAGAAETVEYLADLGRMVAGNNRFNRRSALQAAFDEIQNYEQTLARQLLDGLSRIPGVTIYGVRDTDRLDQRVPTISLTHQQHSPRELAVYLGRQGICVWHGNHYALQLSESLGLEPGGTVRIGLVHYNTVEEVLRLLGGLQEAVCRTKL